jgi:hypothetical protein
MATTDRKDAPMPRTARLTDALRGRGKALVFLGAAAALAGAGMASAATVIPAAQPTAISHAVTGPGLGAVAKMDRAGLVATAKRAVAETAAASPLAPHAVPAHRRASTVELTASNHARAASPRRAAAPQHAAPARPARPWLIYDSVTPAAIPAGHEVATYATGGYAVSPAQVAGRHVLWIDTQGNDPHANALDVEPGDATPTVAAAWAQHKLAAEPRSLPIIYTMRSEWPAVQAAVNTLPGWMHSHIRWWIADPTGYPHIVPGSNATQWYWGQNYDISTANPGF